MSVERPAWGYSLATVRVIRERCKYIRKSTGAVTPTAILDDASDPQSPLHRFFEWDDGAAAEKYRLHQACDLIRRVQVYITREGVKQPMRVYASVVKDDVRQYQEVTEVFADRDLAQSFRAQLKRELEGVIRRYEMHKFCASSIAIVATAISALDDDASRSEAA